MRGVFILLLLVTGCRQLLGFEPPAPTGDDAGSGTDGPGNDSVVFPPGCAGLPQGLLPDTCFDPDTIVMLLDKHIDTDSSPLCSIDRAAQCFIEANEISVSGSIDVVGSRPLVLWSLTTIVVTGTIDASSKRLNGKIGPGANPAACPTTAVAGASATSGGSTIGSGGAGGSFAVPGGGAGGTGRNDTSVIGGPSVGASAGVALRGGCHGGDGGSSAASKGMGGGAVYLMAGVSIRITSSISASGSGGAGGAVMGATLFGGGGGGGSGGLIGLDAPTLELTGARLVALGGGGGSGAAEEGGSLGGLAGSDPDEQQPGAATGGAPTTGSNAGGDGGGSNGGAAMAGGNVSANGVGGGGGGGGGSGHILTFGNVVGLPGIVAPPAN